MKTTLFAFLILAATAAFGQAAGVSVTSEPQRISIPSHQLHASQQAIQTEQSLLYNGSTNSSARGEMPLWEAGAKPPAEAPLGDVARLLRDQHATAKKAVKSMEK